MIIFWIFLLNRASSFVYLSTINSHGELSDLQFDNLKSAFDYVNKIQEFSTHIITLDTDAIIHTLETNIYLKEKKLTIRKIGAESVSIGFLNEFHLILENSYLYFSYINILLNVDPGQSYSDIFEVKNSDLTFKQCQIDYLGNNAIINSFSMISTINSKLIVDNLTLSSNDYIKIFVSFNCSIELENVLLK